MNDERDAVVGLVGLDAAARAVSERFNVPAAEARDALLDARKRLVGVPDVADLAGCSKGTVYRWVRRGELPVARIGEDGSYLFDPEVLERTLEGRATPAGDAT